MERSSFILDSMVDDRIATKEAADAMKEKFYAVNGRLKGVEECLEAVQGKFPPVAAAPTAAPPVTAPTAASAPFQSEAVRIALFIPPVAHGNIMTSNSPSQYKCGRRTTNAALSKGISSTNQSDLIPSTFKHRNSVRLISFPQLLPYSAHCSFNGRQG
ncbi:hypothetical protein IV203_010871 [Nitzschia inconspicua]|uniref:Uncharacterized protein n=1 Tax=Nitzschia inconspicua TaxID=303405 RepID=A0A9K3KYL9_9STRA|nr:hypothetical protein IV203_010871 [Nitzschia inconspicua]